MQPSEGYWDQLWQNGLLFDQVMVPPLVGWTLCSLRECENSVCPAWCFYSQRYHYQEQRSRAPLQDFSALFVFCFMVEQCVPHALTSGGQESEAEHCATVWTLSGSGAVQTVLVPKEVTPQCCGPSCPFYLGR